MRPYVLTIAGFDPSSGAGITSDIKTFEAHECYGLSVCTGITIQNDIELESIKWTLEKDIYNQINILFKRFKIDIVKVGLIESFLVFTQVINILKSYNKNIKIIWDPILKASTGFTFHSDIDKQKLKQIFNEVYLVTPNLIEAKNLFNDLDEQTLLDIKSSILLKGGHSKNEPIDILYTNEAFNIFGKRINITEKHGTGCVLSSSIASNLANGRDLKHACIASKKYIESFKKFGGIRIEDEIYSSKNGIENLTRLAFSE